MYTTKIWSARKHLFYSKICTCPRGACGRSMGLAQFPRSGADLSVAYQTNGFGL